MDLASGLIAVLEKMPTFIRPSQPPIPNPADPEEDYAHKWVKDGRLEENFWLWHASVTADVRKLAALIGHDRVFDAISEAFLVDLTQDERKLFGTPASSSIPAVARGAPAMYIPSAPRPWGVQ